MNQPHYNSAMPMLLDISRVAREMSVSQRTVNRLIATQALKSIKDGGSRRVRATDLTDYLSKLKG